MPSHKIFVIGLGFHEGEWYAEAIAEDGISLWETSTEFEINLPWAMGVTMKSTMAYRKYSAHYPDGFQLIDMLNTTEAEREADKDYCMATMTDVDGKHFGPDE